MQAIPNALHRLEKRRPTFHSEADFQHALAWEIRALRTDSKIRLERPFERLKGRIYLDIWARIAGYRVGVELKYKTRRFEGIIKNETFHLKNQSAQDIARYDFLADLMRLEELVEQGDLDRGTVVFLTNDPGYWRDTGRRNRVDEAFRLHEGRTIGGTLAWADHASDGTTQSRTNPIVLSDTYSLAWRRYSVVNGIEFRYLLLDVPVS